MTRDEFVSLLIRNRTKLTALTWTEFTGAVTAVSLDEKTQILLAVNSGDKTALSTLLINIANTKKTSLATSYVNDIIADNSLTIDELLTLVE